MKKRILMVCAIFVMCACVFVGCTKKEDKDMTTTEKTTMTEKTTKAEEDLSEKLSSGASEAEKDMDDMKDDMKDMETTEKMAS